ncbi:MAG: hypothetical protein QOJ83_761 [Frankiales bacterium]|nr:hypothetical protein [Frankiales bacterium]
MTSIPAPRARTRAPFQLLGFAVVAALSALAWYGWLGWDNEHQVDPVTQVSSGPYETWQVVGCVLTLLAVFVGALLAGARPLLASIALTLAFTTAWTVQAAGHDETGLYGVGTTMILVGLTVATTVVAYVVAAIRGRLAVR